MHYVVADGIGHYRRRGVGAHTAGIGSGITLANALVILCGGQWQRVFAINQHKETGFFANHAFLDDNLCTGVAERAIEHRSRGVHRFFCACGNDHALAGSKPVGLDDDGRAHFFDVGAGRLKGIELGPLGGRHTVFVA